MNRALLPSRLRVMSVNEDKGGCVGGVWLGDVIPVDNDPAFFVSSQDERELEAALARLRAKRQSTNSTNS
jgi:hypothetical protein